MTWGCAVPAYVLYGVKYIGLVPLADTHEELGGWGLTA